MSKGVNPFGDCPICCDKMGEQKAGETYKPIGVLPCGHVFHVGCIKQCFQQPGQAIRKCPMCRASAQEAIKNNVDFQKFNILNITGLDGGVDATMIDERTRDLVNNGGGDPELKEAAQRALEVIDLQAEDLKRLGENLMDLEGRIKQKEVENHNLAAFIVTVRNELQQAKFERSELFLERKRITAELQEERGRIGLLEDELAHLKSDRESLNAIQRLEQGVAAKEVISHMKCASVKEQVNELAKVVVDLSEKIKTARGDKRAMHEELMLIKRRMENLEIKYLAQKKELEEVKKSPDSELIARARRIIEDSDERDKAQDRCQVIDPNRTPQQVPPSFQGARGPGERARHRAATSTPPTASKAASGEVSPSIWLADESSATSSRYFTSSLLSLRKPSPNPNGSRAISRSLLPAGAQSKSRILSSDPDRGATYLRTGPDGMGGQVTAHMPAGLSANKRIASQLLQPAKRPKANPFAPKAATAQDAHAFFGGKSSSQ